MILYYIYLYIIYLFIKMLSQNQHSKAPQGVFCCYNLDHCLAKGLIQGNSCTKGCFDRYLCSGVNLNATNASGKTPIMYAVNVKNPMSFVPKLFKHGADVNIPGPYKETVLHIAVRKQNYELVKYLINVCRAKIDVYDSYMSSPLFEAIDGCDFEMVLLLLQLGANPNIPNAKGKTPLHLSLKYYWENEGIIKCLILFGADPNIKDAKGRSAFDIVRSKKYIEMIELFEDSDIIRSASLP